MRRLILPFLTTQPFDVSDATFKTALAKHRQRTIEKSFDKPAPYD
jgi:hypothetical protein